MAIAANSADQKKLGAERGVQLPRIGAGMNKMPALQMNGDKEDARSKADTSKKERKDQEAEDAKILDTAKKQFKNALTVEAPNRTEGLEDIKFVNGQQWSEADASSRAAEGRPCLTENRIPTFANQIINDQRQNRPAINISPMGTKSSKKDAKLMRGMIRAIERDSSADVAYDTGFQSAVHNGWGYWRVMTEYESETSFNKVIVIGSIPNPFNVYLDPARTPFKLDANWGFVSEMLPIDEFEREYPDAQKTGWGEAGVGDMDKDWINDKEIRVAEYYHFEHEERERVMLDNGFEGWEDELADEVLNDIVTGRFEIVARRSVQCKRLKWKKMTALEILERADCDGQYIPIIECDGTVLNINGKTVKKGIVRDAKSPQRMLNYYSTLETENVALQPKAPWIMEEGQVEGHEAKWQQANRKSFSYLLYKGTNVNGQPAPPPQRQPFAGPPAAILAAKQGAVEALKAITGIRFDATMSERMQDESGKAIRELNNNANLGAYHYIDNFGRALKNTGILIVDLVPHTYDSRRIVDIVDEDGSDQRVMINPDMQRPHGEVPAITPDNPRGKLQMFNPKIGRYKVTVTIGPSYATKRIEAAESQLDFMRVIGPEGASKIMDLVAKNSDWEGADQIAARLAKGLPPNLLTPDREDMSPQTQALIQGLQQQLQQQGLQMQQMNKDLMDREKDRGVMTHQIDSTYKAKAEKTAADTQLSMKEMFAENQRFQQEMQAANKEMMLNLALEMEKLQQKKEAVQQGTIGRAIAELSKAIAAIPKQQDQQETVPDADTPGKSPQE